MRIRLKRVYEEPSPDDGYRVLVERLWPRGLSKEAARLDLWAREVAPSTELRKWFDHDVRKWSEFKSRYFAELDVCPEVANLVRECARRERVTFVFAAKEERFNNAVALEEYLELAGG